MGKVVYRVLCIKNGVHKSRVEIADDYSHLLKFFDKLNVTYSFSAGSRVPLNPRYKNGNQVMLTARDLNSATDLMILDQYDLVDLYNTICRQTPSDHENYVRLFKTPKLDICTQIWDGLIVEERRIKAIRLKKKIEENKARKE